MARVALVTGGMGGLGEAICIKLAALGYTVVDDLFARQHQGAANGSQQMKQQGYDFRAYPCDVADFDSCARSAWRRSRRSSARSTCWSTTPASRAT